VVDVDVHITQMSSTVRAVDGESLLAPEVVDRIARVIQVRLDDETRRRREADDDTTLLPASGRGRGGRVAEGGGRPA
jgi:hypothetical protein